MAELTVELRNLIKTNFELFDFDYEFDDQNFKKELEQAIVDHFFFSEIGQETPDRFKQRFKTRWRRIIPYYNKLYNTTLLSYNPLVNYTIKEGLNQLAKTQNNQDTKASTTTNGNTNSDSNTTTASNTNTGGTTDSELNDKASDYPQQAIAGGDYLSGEKTSKGSSSNNSETNSSGNGKTVTKATSNDTGTSTNEIVSRGTNQTEYEKTIEGLTGTTYQQLISQERENLTRIIDMVIQEMKPSFYLIY